MKSLSTHSREQLYSSQLNVNIPPLRNVLTNFIPPTMGKKAMFSSGDPAIQYKTINFASSVPTSTQQNSTFCFSRQPSNAHTYMQFNGHFPGKLWSAGCPLHFQSHVIFIFSILTEQAKFLLPFVLKQVVGVAHLIRQAISYPLTLTDPKQKFL